MAAPKDDGQRPPEGVPPEGVPPEGVPPEGVPPGGGRRAVIWRLPATREADDSAGAEADTEAPRSARSTRGRRPPWPVVWGLVAALVVVGLYAAWSVVGRDLWSTRAPPDGSSASASAPATASASASGTAPLAAGGAGDAPPGGGDAAAPPPRAADGAPARRCGRGDAGRRRGGLFGRRRAGRRGGGRGRPGGRGRVHAGAGACRPSVGVSGERR